MTILKTGAIALVKGRDSTRSGLRNPIGLQADATRRGKLCRLRKPNGLAQDPRTHDNVGDGRKRVCGLRALCKTALDGTPVRGAVRSLSSSPDGVEAIAMGSLSSETDWTVALRSVGQV